MGPCTSSGEKARKEFRRLVQTELEGLPKEINSALCSCVVDGEGNLVAECCYTDCGQVEKGEKKSKGSMACSHSIGQTEIDSIIAFRRAALDVMRETDVVTISSDRRQTVTIVSLEGGYMLILHTESPTPRTDTLALLSDNAAQRVASGLSHLFRGPETGKL